MTMKQLIKSDLLNYKELREYVLVLRAVNHKLRQRILSIIEEYGSVTVTDLYVKLRMEQSLTSQHLAILRRAGVVNAVRHGKFIYYEVNYKRLNQIGWITTELGTFA